MSKEVDLRKQRKVEADVTIDPTGLATEAKQDAQITQLATLISNTTGLNLEATQLLVKSVLDTIKAKTDNLDVLLSTRNAEATQLLIKAKTDNLNVLLSTRASESTLIEALAELILHTGRLDGINQNTLDTVDRLGDVNETAPTTDTDTSALNGRLQRIAQRITTLINNSLSATQTTTTVASSVTSVLLKASNADRHQITITNTSTKRLWICFFTPATSSTPFFLGKDETWILDEFTGAIYGIWDTGATGNAYITEETF